ncbi:dethiobiotin synthase [Candidatus Ruminimicrobiellum ovillum]|uniref:dethiobiotin synthase n=1 Tax=Candidatus Ruminimicrobiellum ovillum TaxID=1947927 RepID=UPI0035594A44
MTKSIFIAGTSTDIGKTFVTALLVKYLRDKNINAGYFKPVLSGAEIVDNKLVPGDAKYVCDIAGINVQPQDLVSYTFKTAVSPHLAAQMENTIISLDKIKMDFNNLKPGYDFLVVEGCGGIICQISTQKNNEIFLTDIIKSLNLDVILVASSVLGTINSTVLTVEYAKKLNINIKGIIMNFYDKENFMHADNKKQIEYLTGIPVIATVEKNAKEIFIDKNFFDI